MLHPDKKFHSADEFREHFDKCVRYEIHGPIKSDSLDVKQKLLDYQPTDLFSTGIIYPQKNEGSEFNGQQDEIVSAEGLVKK